MTRAEFIREFTDARRRAYAAEPNHPHKVAEDIAGIADAPKEAKRLWKTQRDLLRTITATDFRRSINAPIPQRAETPVQRETNKPGSVV